MKKSANNRASGALLGFCRQVLAAMVAVTMAAGAAAAPAFAANIGVSNASTNATDTGLNVGLVGYWTMDGKNTNWATGQTADSSGNGNTGSLIKMSTTTSPVMGQIGQALQFNGTTQYASIPDFSLAASSGVTMSAWVYVAALPGSQKFIIYNGATSGEAAIGISGANHGTSNKYAFSVDLAGNVWYDAEGPVATPNRWAHIVGVYTRGSSIQVYVNGVLAGTTAIPASDLLSGVGTHSSIGSYDRASGGFFSGSIDDARIYNRALSASEISQLYKQGAATIAKSNTSTNTKTSGLNSGLVGYWTMDGKNMNWTTGQTTDSSGNGNTGSLINMSTTTAPVAGKIGQALKFPGSGAIDMGAGHFPLSPTTPFSGSMWIKSTASYAALVSDVNQGVTGGWYFGFGNNVSRRIDLTLMDSAGANARIRHGSTSVGNGIWHFVAFTYDGSNTAAGINLYVDGTLETMTTDFDTDPGSLVDNDFTVGRTVVSGVAAEYFNGTMDDVRIYYRALSAFDISQLYKQGAATIAQSNTSTNTKTSGLNSGLVGYWTFDGKNTNWATGQTTDSSGNGNTGSLVNMSTTSSPVMGEIGQAISFPGTGGQTSVTATAGDYTNNFSISAWTKARATPVTSEIMSKGWDFINGANRQYLLRMNDANTVGFYDSNTTLYSATVTGVGTVGQWHLLTVVISGASSRIYVDGSPAGSTFNPTIVSKSGSFIIGGAYNGAPTIVNTFNGAIDDTRIYNRALSAAEVKQLYLSEK